MPPKRRTVVDRNSATRCVPADWIAVDGRDGLLEIRQADHATRDEAGAFVTRFSDINEYANDLASWVESYPRLPRRHALVAWRRLLSV